MRFTRGREKLSNFELRKFMLDRRKKKEMELQMNKEAQSFLEKMKQGISSISQARTAKNDVIPSFYKE